MIYSFILNSQYFICVPEPTKMPPSPTQSSGDDSWNSTDLLGSLLDNSSSTTTMSTLEDQRARKLHEFQIIKAVVLATVTAIIMFSVCKMVFQLFIRYSGKQDDRWKRSMKSADFDNLGESVGLSVSLCVVLFLFKQTLKIMVQANLFVTFDYRNHWFSLYNIIVENQTLCNIKGNT